jgi:hypothetical protein
MSISEKFFRRLEERANPEEIYYYQARCEFNMSIALNQNDKIGAEKFQRQAIRLFDLRRKVLNR